MKLALSLTSLAAAACLSSIAYANDVLITASQMLDVRTGKMVSNPSILVRDGRIVSVKQGEQTVAADTKKIHLAGMTLLALD